jgi:DNA mismatch endonuclease (patch repair protein)
MMAAVKSQNTIPEKTVRSALFREGFRYRIHKRGLPGNPDIVLPRYRTVVFVHGCFWHGHDCRKGMQRPKTRTKFWNTKLDKNIARDESNRSALEAKGWKVFIVWTCSIELHTEHVLEYLKKKRGS